MITLKVTLPDGTTRRRQAPRDGVTLDSVRAMLPQPATYTLTYQDDEGDIILIHNKLDLQEAIRQAKSQSLRIIVAHGADSATDRGAAASTAGHGEKLLVYLNGARNYAIKFAPMIQPLGHVVLADVRSVRSYVGRLIQDRLHLQSYISWATFLFVLWILLFPSFTNLTLLGLGWLLLPGNSMTPEGRKRAQVAAGCLALRIALRLLFLVMATLWPVAGVLVLYVIFKLVNTSGLVQELISSRSRGMWKSVLSKSTDKDERHLTPYLRELVQQGVLTDEEARRML